MTAVHHLQIATVAPFELDLVLRGHGWVSLPPHRFDDDGDTPWRVPLRLPVRGGERSALATVRQRGRTLRVELCGERRLGAAALAAAEQQLAHMLRLHDDLRPFWAICRDHADLAWVARRGAGRLLRSATVFEDLLKLLFTTNCSWAATTAMTRNLVQAIGPPAPDGERAFPSARDCDRGAAFYREVVRAGYRARACAELAARFASGELTDAQFLAAGLSTADLRRRLLSLHGFGPYAAGQALRLLGRYDDLALDSWCRATMAERLGRARPPSDAAIARRYRPFGPFAGLALWCDLTAPWHGE